MIPRTLKLIELTEGSGCKLDATPSYKTTECNTFFCIAVLTQSTQVWTGWDSIFLNQIDCTVYAVYVWGFHWKSVYYKTLDTLLIYLEGTKKDILLVLYFTNEFELEATVYCRPGCVIAVIILLCIFDVCDNEWPCYLWHIVFMSFLPYTFISFSKWLIYLFMFLFILLLWYFLILLLYISYFSDSD